MSTLEYYWTKVVVQENSRQTKLLIAILSNWPLRVTHIWKGIKGIWIASQFFDAFAYRGQLYEQWRSSSSLCSSFLLSLRRNQPMRRWIHRHHNPPQLWRYQLSLHNSSHVSCLSISFSHSTNGEVSLKWLWNKMPRSCRFQREGNVSQGMNKNNNTVILQESALSTLLGRQMSQKR